MLCRPIRHFPRLPDRHTLTCAVALLSFVFGSVGFPLELIGRPKSGCRCDDGLQASGGCCCQKSARTASGGSCCAKPIPTQPKRSCCRPTKEDDRDDTHDETNSEDLGPAAASACSCGGAVDVGFLINSDPRVLSRAITVPGDDAGARLRSPVTPSPANPSIAPETPPPKMPTVLVS
jgi:hypothetical protein